MPDADVRRSDAQPASGALLAVFFYGLYMDADVLAARGVLPRHPRRSAVADHVVQLGAKAMLLPAPGQRAHGMVYALTRAEVDSLYAGLDDYVEVPLNAMPDDGEALTAICWVHRVPPVATPPDPVYAAAWRRLVERLQLPVPPTSERSPSC